MRGYLRGVSFLVALISCLVAGSVSANPVKVTNLNEIIQFSKLKPYLAAKYASNLSRVKIAIIDPSFAGLKESSLPKNVHLTRIDKAESENDELGHGVYRYVTVSDMTEGRADYYLYEMRSVSGFVEAVARIRALKADIVSFSSNWEKYGNFNDSGPINDMVRSAVADGIIWINAAGNDAGGVYNGPVNLQRPNEKDNSGVWVKFTNGQWFLRFKNHVNQNPVTITLSWNRNFSEMVEEKGVQKAVPVGDGGDLSLSLHEGASVDQSTPLTEIARNDFKQVKGKVANAEKDETVFPFEAIQTKLDAGKVYFVAVGKGVKGQDVAGPLLKEFSPSKAKDMLRVTIKGGKSTSVDPETKKVKPAIEFLDASETMEIPTPADSVGFTVGDTTKRSSRGPTLDGRSKPDTLLGMATVEFTDRYSVKGTSFAEAIQTGIVALMKAANPGLKQKHLLQFRTRLPESLLAAHGWRISPLLQSVPSEVFDYLKSWDCASDCPVRYDESATCQIGFTCGLKDIPFVMKDPNRPKNMEDYRVYFRLQRWTEKLVENQAVTKRTPDQEVVVRRGYTEKVFRGYSDPKRTGYLGVNTPFGFVPTHELIQRDPIIDEVYRPPVTRTQKGREWVEYERVSKDVPKSHLSIVWVDKKGKPSEPPHELVEIVPLDFPKPNGEGLVISGTNNNIFWETPTPERLNSVVRSQ